MSGGRPATSVRPTMWQVRRVSLRVDDYMAQSSRTHRMISGYFTRVGLHHRNEVQLGPFMIDIVRQTDRHKDMNERDKRNEWLAGLVCCTYVRWSAIVWQLRWMVRITSSEKPTCGRRCQYLKPGSAQPER